MKSEYKNYVSIDISNILGLSIYNGKVKRYRKANSWLESEEHNIFNSDGRYFNFEDLYNNENMLEEAKGNIKNKTNLNNLGLYIEDIKENISEACRRAYESDYNDKAYTYAKDSIQDLVEKAINELELKKYKVIYYSDEDKTLHGEFKYNTTEIRLYIPVLELMSLNKVFNFEDYEEVIDELQNTILYSKEEINWEHFDYYGNIASCDDWYSYFTDYEEISYKVLKDRKVRNEKIKGYIKNNVSLIYRN